ncbi:MAG: hypothetical protein QMD65_00305 [Patescibacteria group bacterium]|nr:hypothetical protein [Patescibacteria group bacterium]
MKFSPTKKSAAVIIIITSIFASVFIIFSSQTPQEKGFLKISANLNDANPYLNFKALTNNGLTEAAKKTENKVLTDNLTDQLINNYGYEILKRNPSGPLNRGGGQSLTMPSQNLLQKLLEDKLTQNLKIDFYEIKDLKIGNDNSLKAVRAYLEVLNSVNKKNLLVIKKSPFAMFNDFFRKKNPDQLYQYLGFLSSYTTDLLKISVPSSWQAFHLELLNLEQKKITIYQTLVNAEQDPVKALIAAQEIEKIDQEELDLATVLQEKLKDLNI